MIEFATLFLALTLGPQSVEMVAAAEVSAVEIRLDGEVLTRVEAPPWKATVDFGEDVLPHELVAVAFDEKGDTAGETRQWINYGRGRAEARWVLEPVESWPPRKARLVWRSFDGRAPEEVKVRFDGEPVELRPDMTVHLGAADASTLHALEAELRFGRNLETQAVLTFGGEYGEAVSTALTAVPLQLPRGTRPPKPARAASWLRLRSGEPVRVHSVKADRGLVAFVRDRHLPRPPDVGNDTWMGGGSRARNRRGRVNDLFLMETKPDPAPAGAGEANLFRVLDVDPTNRGRGLLYVAERLAPKIQESLPVPEGEQQLYDALAAAGKLAAESGQRRAVLLLKDPRSEDGSDLTPRQVETYLEALRVPCFSWVRKGGRSLRDVARELEQELERQVIVWIEGSHLPQSVELTEEAPGGAAFAGSSPVAGDNR